jgi:hypothetical protein
MSYHLIVVHPFGIYARGDRITDEAEMQRVLASHNHPSVNKIAAPDAPPAPETAPLTLADE